MKKLLFLLSVVFLFAACPPVTAATLEKVPVEFILDKNAGVKDTLTTDDTGKVIPVVIKGLIEACKDSAFRAEATIAVENMKTEWYAMPVKGSSIWTWLKWIVLFLVIPFSLISTFIARFIPTSYAKKYKVFRVIEWVADFLYWVAKLMPNKNSIGGKHEEK